MRAGPALVAAVVLVGWAAAGCQGASKPAAAQGPVTLRFATAAGFDTGGQKHPLQDFVDRIHSLSGGRILVSVTQNVGEGSATAEPSLIKAIEQDTYDGGWNSVRGFPAADIHAFEAVEAPFVIESYPVEEQFVSSPLAGQMLTRLKGTGLIGLGLIAGPLRRPFAVAHPLLQPSDWRGVAFRIEDTPEQKATVAALGARAVLLGWGGFDDQIKDRSVGGQEFDLFAADADEFERAEPYVTANVTLWPKPFVVMMNDKRFASLTPQQQRWIREAAQSEVAESANDPFTETATAAELCAAGQRFADASAVQLADLRRAAKPVYDQLRADPLTAADLAALQAMSAAQPAASEPTVASACRGSAPS